MADNVDDKSGRDSSSVTKAEAPKYLPVDYSKGVVDSGHLRRNRPDKVMAIEGGHPARSALDKNYLTCKATEGGSSCKPATTWWQAPGEYMEQATPVCDKHAQKLSTNALSREPNPDHYTALTLGYPQTWPIKPKDVQRDTDRTARENLEMRTLLEVGLYSKGMRDKDAIVNRRKINVGEPGPETHFSRSSVEKTITDARDFGGHQTSLPASALRDIDPETGDYVKEVRHPDYLRKKGADIPGKDPRPKRNKEANARGGKAGNPVEPPKPLANTFNSDGSQAYGHTVDQPIGFGAGDIDWHPEKYPEEVASHKLHVQQPRARGFSKEKNRAPDKVMLGKPFKPEYPGGLAKFISESKEKRDRDAIDLTSNDLMLPGSSRASAFELAQDEGRKAPAIENVRKPKELG
jgi:hypothetical protein